MQNYEIPTVTPEEPWAGLGYVVARAGVHANTVYNAIKAGRLKAYRVGRQYRFKPSDVERWIAPFIPADGSPMPNRGTLDDAPVTPLEVAEAARDAEAGA